MANDLRGELDVEIGGRSRRFKFTMNAIREAQKSLKVNGMVAIWEAIFRLDIDAITYLLWLGLRHDDSKLKIEEVRDWDMTVDQITKIVSDGLKSATRGDEKKDEKEEGEDPKA